MKRTTVPAAYILFVMLAFAAPLAKADHADMLIAQNPAGKLVTGIADFDNFNFVIGERSFLGELTQVDLGDDPRALFFIDDPGFNSRDQATLDLDNPPAGSFLALPGNADVNFSFPAITIGGQTANLFYWNGTGAVDFQPTTDMTLTLSVGSDAAIADGTANTIAGFNLETTSVDGVIHRHPDYVLDQITGSAYPAEGVYLLPLVAQMAGKTDSDFFTIAFKTPNISDEVQQMAADYVAAHVVPEPSTWLLAAAGVVALCCRRRVSRRE